MSGGAGSALHRLVGASLGSERAGWLLSGLHLDPSLLGEGGWLPRAVLAQAMGVVLLDDLLSRVPSGAAYFGEKVGRGEQAWLDHGAVRTVSGVGCGALPPGQDSVTRVLSALGYRHRETYPLTKLRMTGRSWCHVDLPEAVPQYFVSELHAEEFSPGFQEAAARVLGTSRDPLADPHSQGLLAGLQREGGLALDDAQVLLPVLVSCFGRHHQIPTMEDYLLLRAESEEMAWIATEGTVFNHATDRVADVAAVADAERRAGRPIKESAEVSASGRIRQTAHRAAMVQRIFSTGPATPGAVTPGAVMRRGATAREATPGGATVGAGDGAVALDVPGSFFEFITRDPLPDGSGLDLAFDAANAQQIFAMTRTSG